MKTGEDFRREFPETEEGFKDHVYSVLQSVHDKKRRAHMRIKPIAAFVLIMLMMMSVGIAATVEKWSLFDSVPDSWITADEDETAQMKASFEPVQIDGRLADVTVREAIYDGFGLYLVIDVRPANPAVFLMPDDNMELTDAASSVASFFPKDVTLEEHIKTLGYTKVYRVDVMSRLLGTVFPASMKMSDDGTFTFFYRQRLMEEQDMMQPEITTNLMVHIKEYSDERVNNGSTIREYISSELPLKVQPMIVAKGSADGESHVFENSGWRMSHVRIYKTLLTTYLIADVEVVDQEKFDNRHMKYTVFAVDEDGNRLKSGYFNLYGIMQDYHTDEYYYSSTHALNELPEEFTIAEALWEIGEDPILLDQWTFPLVDVE